MFIAADTSFQEGAASIDVAPAAPADPVNVDPVPATGQPRGSVSAFLVEHRTALQVGVVSSIAAALIVLWAIKSKTI